VNSCDGKGPTCARRSQIDDAIASLGPKLADDEFAALDVEVVEDNADVSHPQERRALERRHAGDWANRPVRCAGPSWCDGPGAR
jgi:hypothetical protein